MTMLVEDDISKSEDAEALYAPLYRDENELEKEREREEKEREREEKEREREEKEREREEREKERKFEGDKAKLCEMQLQYDEVEKRKQREHELELARITQPNALQKIDKEQEAKKKLIFFFFFWRGGCIYFTSITRARLLQSVSVSSV